MYTQCEQCKAIFRVNMREVTVAKGQLRCGECNAVFNATKSLSTTMPTSFEEVEELRKLKEKKAENKSEKTYDKNRAVQATPLQFKKSKKENRTKSANKKINWSILAILFLLLTLAAQVAYNKRYLFLSTPRHQPQKIQMLNHNIFAHPNESGVLLISAQIENTAKKAQPYPVLALSLKNAQSELVAFRRFLPKEYLTDYSEDQLIPPNIPITLKLKIKDPGSKATRFQFDFL